MARKRIIKKRITMKDKLAYKAKQEGYRARSAYKLKELNNKYKLITEKSIVVDIGAWPGSWMQVAYEKAGDEGLIVGIDMKPIDPFPMKNLVTIQADVMTQVEEIIRAVMLETGGKVNVVLSDIAPQTSGIREVDQHKSYELCMKALELAKRLLKKNGKFLVKMFESEDTPAFQKEVKRYFGFSKLVRPTATKKRSKEIYIVARLFKGVKSFKVRKKVSMDEEVPFDEFL